jgi:hypothetical protein
MIGNFDAADGIRRRMQNELEESHQRKEARQQQMRLVGIDKDDTTVSVALGATRALDASSADGGWIYKEGVRDTVHGKRERGVCPVVGYQY